MERILFIINPISGTSSKTSLPDLISSQVDSRRFDFDIVFTERKGHGTELARSAASDGYAACVAVGGDGTVNEVACGLRDMPTALGILPIGSGNGLARTLGYPMSVGRSLQLLNKSVVRAIDYGMLNDHAFFCTCGTGFDAQISHNFALQKSRGLMTYIRTMLPTYATYKPQHVVLDGDDFHVDTHAFFVTVANAGQWGNNAYVAPKASLTDGLLDVCIMSRMPVYEIPMAVFNMFTHRMDKDLFMTTLRTASLTITRDAAAPFHYDGEPNDEPASVSVRLQKSGLKVLVEDNRIL